MHYTAKIRKHFFLDNVTSCRSSGERGMTGSLRVMPQERDQRRTVVQIVDRPLVVPSLDVPMPQMENQLVEVCWHLDLPIPEQAVEVPKISSSSRLFCERQVPMVQQTAEQLVEVSLHGFVDQIMLTFQFRVLEVFTDQFLLLHHRTHLVPWMRFYRVFSHFTPK